MKRLGYRAAVKTIDSKDGNIDKKVKSYKRGEKQRAKRNLYKELKDGVKEMGKKRMADGLKQGLEEAIQMQKDDLLSKLPVAKNCNCKPPCRISCIWGTKTHLR